MFLNQLGTQYVDVQTNKNSGSGQIFINYNAILLKFVYVSTKVFKQILFINSIAQSVSREHGQNITIKCPRM